MNILVCASMDPEHPRAGGAQAYLGEILRRWVIDGHQITLLTSRVPGRPTEEFVNGTRVLRLGSVRTLPNRAKRWWSATRPPTGLLVELIDGRPLRAHRWRGGPPSVALVPRSAAENQLLPADVADRGARRDPRGTLRDYRFTPILAGGATTAGILARSGLQRVVSLPEAIAPPQVTRRARKEGRPTVVWSDRLALQRRPQDAIVAFAALRECQPEAQLWMIGHGPLRSELGRNAPPGVRFWGEVTPLERQLLVGRAHLHLVTGDRDGWCTSVDEAALLGTPTLAYETEGWRHAIPRHGGWVTSARPESLTEVMGELLPRLMAEGPRTARVGGVLDWGLMAETLLEQILDLAEVVHPTRRRPFDDLLPTGGLLAEELR